MRLAPARPAAAARIRHALYAAALIFAADSTPARAQTPAAPAAPAAESPQAAPSTDQALPTPAPSLDRQVLRMQRGDTLSEMLRAVGIAPGEAATFIAALRHVLDMRDLREGQEIVLMLAESADGESEQLMAARIATAPGRHISVERAADGSFRATVHENPLTREHVRAAGVVRSSLYAAGTNAGMPAGVLAELIRAFSYDVDFQREVQVGDRFEVAFERFTDATGNFARDGAIIFAALTLSGTVRRVYRHQTGDGAWDYYNERGESVRKALLRTPIDGARLTSRFGSRRHPILGYTAFHRGVDFGAAPGTPIQAAGDGRIEQLGWHGGYGNYIRIRHTGEYATAYAHMSRFARGLRSGAPVRQGQVIGYVGSTGRSTGPHLHYEIIRGGRQVNPIGVRFATGRKLGGAELERFNATRGRTDLLVASLPVRTQEIAQRQGPAQGAGQAGNGAAPANGTPAAATPRAAPPAAAAEEPAAPAPPAAAAPAADGAPAAAPAPAAPAR
ncbi:MAG: M23 family metallopeptidase [Alphaproteobacteria bacterium]|nr:M23 family metallopeptidase [Alphaproteobacteria bacterium]